MTLARAHNRDTVPLTMLFSQLGAGHSIYSVSYRHCNYYHYYYYYYYCIQFAQS